MTATLSLFRPSILDPAPEPSAAQEEIRAARLAPTLGDRLLAERRRAEASAAAVMAPPAEVPPPAETVPVAAPVVGATLDDLLVGVWEDLTTHRTVACPACGDEMVPRYSAGPAPVGGRCTSCGTTLA